MKRSKLVATFTTLLLGFVLLPSATAQSNNKQPVSRSELKDLLVQITSLLDAQQGKSEKIADLRRRIDALDAQAFERLYQASNNWDHLRIAVALMQKGSNSKKPAVDDSLFASGSYEVSPAGLPADLFPPGYPAGSNYDTFRASIVTFGGITDAPGSLPGLADERCDSNFEAGVAIAQATFAFANIIADNVCEALPELLDIPCWVANGVLQLAAEATNTVAAQCSIVDGAVDAAEIQAGYKNSVSIYKNLDAHHLSLVAHNTNLNNVSTAIQFLINKHDGDMKAAVSKHDAEIKLLLAAIKTVVDGNTQQLKVVQTLDTQIIRLLLTPEGLRAVNPLVMTCTGDNCPKVLNCPGNQCSFPVKP
jgi:hypothetical protein